MLLLFLILRENQQGVEMTPPPPPRPPPHTHTHSSGFGKNRIILDADMSSSVQMDNKKNHILVCSKGPILTVEKEYPIRFSE